MKRESSESRTEKKKKKRTSDDVGAAEASVSFDSALSGVVFTLSGVQNPYRGEVKLCHFRSC